MKIKIYLLCAIILIGLLGNYTFAVSTIPVGGSSFGTATLLGPGTYQGSMIEEEITFYRVQANAGQEIKVEINSNDTWITIFNDKEEELQFGDGDEPVYWLPNSDKSTHSLYLKISNEAFAPIESFTLKISLINRYDANSQTDAGDTFEKALNITTGEYQGYLSGTYPLMTPKGDDFKDYYKLSVKKGITYTFKVTPPSADEIGLELFSVNRESIDEKSSANSGAIVNLSLAPIADTNIFILVAHDGPISGEVLNYKLNIDTSVPLTKFYVCAGESCGLAGEFSSKEACQISTTKTCYSSVNCDDQCGGSPTSTTIVPPTTKPQNECTINQTKCFDNFNYQKCGNYDDDSYLEWSSPVYCGESYKCENGKCITKPGGCQCSAWVKKECAGNDCQANEIYQTRTCEPESCDKEEQCLADATCKVIPACIKNSNCPKGFICKTGECIVKGIGWWGWLSLVGGGFIGWFFWLYLILLFGLYIYLALCLQVLAKKTNTPNGWLAWIPIADIFLMLQIAQKPLWWFLLFLIPIVNIVIGIIIWMKIAERVGKPNWVGVLLIVPVIGIAIPGYLAFSGGEKIEPITPYASTGTEAANKPTVGYKHPCKYCGKLIPPNSAVCPLCGKANPQGPYRCPKCHEPIEKNWQACSHCGQNLRIVCPKCGKITFFGDYCEDCSARLLVTCPHCNQEQPPLGDKCIKCDGLLENKK